MSKIESTNCDWPGLIEVTNSSGQRSSSYTNPSDDYAWAFFVERNLHTVLRVEHKSKKYGGGAERTRSVSYSYVVTLSVKIARFHQSSKEATLS
jgi:hypothetical protein